MDRIDRRAVRHVRASTYWLTVAILCCIIGVLGGITLKLVIDRRHNPILGDIHNGQVRVNDGASEVWITPWEGSVPAGFKAEDFTVENGKPVYLGKDYETSYGIDVSEWQGRIDWSAVKNSGVDFAFVRLGARGTGAEGKLLTDDRGRENLQNARAAGVKVGVYFFSQATSAEEAREEARFVLELLDGAALDLPVMFDWEKVGSAEARTAAMDYGTLTACAKAFLEAVEQEGYRAGIYTNRQLGYYAYELGELRDYPLWVAEFNSWPDFYYRFEVWQYSDSSTCPGIEGAVDRNMMFTAK